MRYRVRTALFVVILVLIAPHTVFAEDYITDATQALQQARVYVYPGTPGTTNDTTAQLQSRLKNDDNIVLVMLPTTATTDLGLDPSTIAARISEALGNDQIIGLAVGGQVVGYSFKQPVDVADQMRRADNVSNDPVTALETFIDNIHNWQAKNRPSPTSTPKPKPTPTPTPKPKPQHQKDDNSPFEIWELGPAGAVLGFVALLIRFRMRQAGNKNRRHVEVPGKIKDQLASIKKQSEQIKDYGLQSTLDQLCVDMSNFFVLSSHNVEGDTLYFVEQLNNAIEMIDAYIFIQDNKRYYTHHEVQLARVKKALTEFGETVLETTRQGLEANMGELNKKAIIFSELRAQIEPDRDLHDFDRRLQEGTKED